MRPKSVRDAWRSLHFVPAIRAVSVVVVNSGIQGAAIFMVGVFPMPLPLQPFGRAADGSLAYRAQDVEMYLREHHAELNKRWRKVFFALIDLYVPEHHKHDAFALLGLFLDPVNLDRVKGADSG
jgi:hypothetical protein